MDNRSASVTWFGVAVAALTASAGLLVALIVVLRTRAADVLAVVALVLAVVSLLSQLVIALAQFFAGARQQESNAELNRQTHVALAEIRSLSADLSQRLSYQVELLTGARKSPSDSEHRTAAVLAGAAGGLTESVLHAQPNPETPTSAHIVNEASIQAWLRENGARDVERVEDAPNPYLIWAVAESRRLAVVVKRPLNRDSAQQVQRVVSKITPEGLEVDRRFVVGSPLLGENQSPGLLAP
jgi:hypothetical protein